MPLISFTASRDHSTYAIYQLHESLPVTVEWPTCRATLRIKRLPHPPHLVLEFDTVPECRESGCVYELESRAHGDLIARHGLKVTVPSALDGFCARLVKDGRASMIAGPHSEVPWTSSIEIALDRRHPETCLDAFWTWHRWCA